ncbi:MAG TPA: Nif3-like dinuclear metal center hexameric protein [Bacilli bacterium]
MFANGETVIQLFEQFAPKYYAVPDDRIGLQLGTLQKEIKKVLVTLDVTDEVAEEAIALKADLIIAHHAIIFRPLVNLRTDLPAGRLYEKLLKADIAVYIAHTNLDVAEGGINDLLAEALGLSEVSCLEEIHTDKLRKLVVFVPEEHHERVMDAIFAAGAGFIGQYSHCSFHLPGTGTFKPQAGAKPYVGSIGNIEKVREVRIETIVPESLQKKVVAAMLAAHPYEEPAYDLYPLDLPGKAYGLGRVGRLPGAVKLRELAETVKRSFAVSAVRVVGDLSRSIRKVAVLGGSGGRYVKHALLAGADVLITGDIDYHTAHDALAAGLAIIDCGHHAEKIMKDKVAGVLREKLAEKQFATEIAVSAVNTEPFQFL